MFAKVTTLSYWYVIVDCIELTEVIVVAVVVVVGGGGCSSVVVVVLVDDGNNKDVDDDDDHDGENSLIDTNLCLPR